MKIILEHVRCFSKRRSVPIRPLTLLVGENSSGKSTFLSVVSSVLDQNRFPASTGFNEPPYSLGAFDTIATYRGGRAGRSETFSIGFQESTSGKKEYRELIATYASKHGNPSLTRFEATSSHGRLGFSVGETEISGNMELAGTDVQQSATIKSPIIEGMFSGPHFLHQLAFEAVHARGENNLKEDAHGRARFLMLVTALTTPPMRCYSFAPIRSKAQRTYDEVASAYSPEGEHVPSLLAQLLRQNPDSADSKLVMKALTDFGTESGMFKEINVKKLGHKLTDPFQIQVTGVGPSVNLVDVGYGVSQALPIVAQSVLKSTGDVLLLQQPEVHLHPRAQAALGTFFVNLAKTSRRKFLVETHSDSLVDRVRQEVAKGTIDSSDVSILFFDKPSLDTVIHEIGLDDRGNVVDAPPEYRRFFLQEEINLFTRTQP